MRIWEATLSCDREGWHMVATKLFSTRALGRISLAVNRAELVAVGAQNIRSSLHRVPATPNDLRRARGQPPIGR